MSQVQTPTATELTTDPDRFWDLSVTELYSIPLGEVHEIQRQALANRFADLIDRVPMVKKLAGGQSITAIENIVDAAPLLFQHSIYKSYPISYLEKNRFDKLTQWLDKLTTFDLSGLDASSVDTIDDWIDFMDANTQIRIRHSSGTSGKLSFLPGGPTDYLTGLKGWADYFRGFGSEPDVDVNGFESMPVLFPSYRSGAMHQHRLLDKMVETVFGGDETMVVALNPGRMSADALSLGGRLAAAEARGEMGEIQLSPKLIERRDAFIAARANADEDSRRFFATMADRFRGRRVALMGSIGQIFDVSEAGKAGGLDHVFAPDSLVMMGGGMKGRQLPGDWYETVSNFLGVEGLRDGFGMTELVAATRSCPAGFYHLPPVFVPYVLDIQTGEQMPRTGEQTGRLGIYDLTRTEMWGGFLTGDKVTLRWGDTNPCGCGRVGVHLTKDITRIGAADGGDDKITCAGAPAAHDKALDYLSAL